MAHDGGPVLSAARRRVRYFVLAIATIVVGLTVHLGGGVLPPTFRDVLGDALWAAMIVWWIGVAVPHVPLPARGVAALLICVAVETSQRWHTPVLDQLRSTLPGQLVLGSGYDPRDFLAYAAGVALAVVLARTCVE